MYRILPYIMCTTFCAHCTWHYYAHYTHGMESLYPCIMCIYISPSKIGQKKTPNKKTCASKQQNTVSYLCLGNGIQPRFKSLHSEHCQCDLLESTSLFKPYISLLGNVTISNSSLSELFWKTKEIVGMESSDTSTQLSSKYLKVFIIVYCIDNMLLLRTDVPYVVI